MASMREGLDAANSETFDPGLPRRRACRADLSSSLWYLLNLIGLIPPERPAWPFDPIPPFGVPSVISKAFWGGVWGAVLAPLLSRLRGRSYWAGWITVAAIALPLVAFFVVPPIKGEPVPELWPRFLVSMMVNGAWDSARRYSCGSWARHKAIEMAEKSPKRPTPLRV